MNNRELLYVGGSGTDPVAKEVAQRGWEVCTAPDTNTARNLIDQHGFRVGLTHLKKPAGNDLDTMEDLLLCSRQMEWVALTEPATLEDRDIRGLVHQSFFDYHTLPPDPARLEAILGHAWGMAELKARDTDTTLEGDEYQMVGTSPVMQQLFRTIRKLAPVSAPVLVCGESGTGKELTARALHERSPRAGGPFIAVNCGALPSGLIQSELFGHEKGAFTGAHQRKAGRFETAHGGTIFLDEIGDLSLDLQVNLLRVLQEQTIERVGGTESIDVDVRVIAATHVDLEQAVAEKRFREDLYYRLNVLRVDMPALREREGDVEVLAHFFFNRFRNETGGRVRGFSQQALRTLADHPWPGNLRELINRIRRAMVMCEGRLITPSDLGLERRSTQRSLVSLEEARESADRSAILTALRHCKNNVSLAARYLDISRVTLYRLMEKHGIRC